MSSAKKTPLEEESGKCSPELSNRSLICLCESVRKGLIPSGCDIYWGIIRDADKDKKNTSQG